MELNADFSQRVLVHGATAPWVSSPTPGVERVMLDRLGEEVARATSFVRYAKGHHFPHHVHGGGEEFLVLDGKFQDQYGEFPAGFYVRNPPQTSHRPFADSGCVIFVKLWQFDPRDREQFSIQTRELKPVAAAGRDGVSIIPLWRREDEDVRIEVWDPHASVAERYPGGVELLVIDGAIEESFATLKPRSWLRLPPGATLQARAGANGARLWVKSAHLAKPAVRPGFAAPFGS